MISEYRLVPPSCSPLWFPSSCTSVPIRTPRLATTCLPITVFLSYLSHKKIKFSATTRSGCNPLEYDWCQTNKATWPTIFIPVIVGVMGVGLPMAQIALDTIYSRILGKIDQTVLQGAIVAAEDVVLVLGPLYSSWALSISPINNNI